MVRMDGRRLTRVAAALVLIAVIALAAHQMLITAWSNHCDPGNAQFDLLKTDPVVSFHAPRELFTWENDAPDNSWTCTNPSLSVNHVGQDVSGMYAATTADMKSNGWTAIDLGQARDFGIFEKRAAGGVRLTAVVLKQNAWVEVDLSAPGLHPGERGF